MKKLGIVINHVKRREFDRTASPAYPLISFSYARSGFIRLAGLKNIKK